MKKYRVVGNTTVVVTKELWACNPDDAIKRANDQLNNLIAYCGNGGYDKLIGVDGYDESVDAPDDINWDDYELLEEDPDYFECPECEAECEMKTDAEGVEYWECPDCMACYDSDGYEFYPAEEDEPDD